MHQLEVAPTATMWMHLGSVIGEIEHYEHAWTLSNQHLARAKLKLGSKAMRLEQWEEARARCDRVGLLQAARGWALAHPRAGDGGGRRPHGIDMGQVGAAAAAAGALRSCAGARLRERAIADVR